jgi:hypothetical protein
MNACGGGCIDLHVVEILLEVIGRLYAPAALLVENPPPPGTHRSGGWVGPRAGLDDVEKRKSYLYRDSNCDP